MAATILIPFLPPGLVGLTVKLSPAASEPEADPAGYALTDAAGDGRYSGLVGPYNAVQPAGKYWCRVFRPSAATPAMADWIILVDAASSQLGDLSAAQLADTNDRLSQALDALQCDQYIDKSAIPWQVVKVRKGTSEEISRQYLLDIEGHPIETIRTFVAEQRTVTTTSTTSTTTAATTTTAAPTTTTFDAGTTTSVP